jgi:hypothetical protein
LSKAQSENPVEVKTPADPVFSHRGQKSSLDRAADSTRQRDWHWREPDTIVINDKLLGLLEIEAATELPVCKYKRMVLDECEIRPCRFQRP